MTSPDIPRIPTLRLMFHLARYQPWLYIAMVVTVVLIPTLLSLVPGLVLRYIFDILSSTSSATWNLWALIAVFVLAGLGRQMFFLIGFVCEFIFLMFASTLLHRQMLQRIMQQPGASALPASPGDVVSRFRDDVETIMSYVTYIPDVVVHTLVIILGVAILASINPLYTLAVVLPLLITLLAVNIASRHIRRFRLANQAAIGAVTGLLGEMFGAVQAIKIAGTERFVVQHFEQVSEQRRHAALKDVLLSQFLSSFSSNVANSAIGILLLVTAQAMQSDSGIRFTVGDFTLFVAYVIQFALIIQWITDVFTRHRQTEVSLQRLLELMDERPPEALVEHAPVYLRGPLPQRRLSAKMDQPCLATLTAAGLTYYYPGTQHGIDNINLSLKRGTLTVITGNIGSGKTTLLRVLLGLLPKTAGAVYWNDTLIDEAATFFVPPRSGYVPQVPRLFSEQLRDNLLLGLPAEAVNLQAALHSAVLERDVNQLEAGLATVVGPRGTRLSGGQLQRAAVARMLVQQPELLVLDDVSSALDVQTARLLWQRLCNSPHPYTILAVAHQRHILRRADHIVLLKEGRIEAEGSLAMLLEHSTEMQLLWAEQTSDHESHAPPPEPKLHHG